MRFKEEKKTLRNGKTVTLRSPYVHEAEKILAMMAKGADETPYLLSTGEDFRKMSIEQEEGWIENTLQGDDCTIMVLYEDEIIAISTISFLTGHKKTVHRSNVGITVLKEYWDQGIGNILFEEMIRIARQHEGTSQIELGVISENPRARHLYEKFGFKETGVIPRALRLEDGTYLDEIMMVRYLDKEQ